MTGPDHYLAAERLQEHARAMAAADDSPDEAITAARVQRRMADLAEAQVHAALALAAVLGISAGLSGAGMAGVAQGGSHSARAVGRPLRFAGPVG
jgi:hypothetical protein